MAKKPRVFVSFSKDDLLALSQVRDALENQGFLPYVATQVVQPGQHISRKIEDAIRSSDAFVVILTVNSVTSPWVQQEIGYAKGKLPIIPLKAQGVKPPALLEGCDCINMDDQNVLELGSIVHEAIRSFIPAKPEEVCDEGPYDIDPGTYIEIPLDVDEGDSILGRIEESDGEEFDWYIVNEKNLVKYKKREDFSPAKSDENIGASTLKWSVKGCGPWFLLLSLYGKKNTREVTVSLRRTS